MNTIREIMAKYYDRAARIARIAFEEDRQNEMLGDTDWYNETAEKIGRIFGM